MRIVFIVTIFLLSSASAEAAKSKPAAPVFEFLNSRCEQKDGNSCANLALWHLELGRKREADIAFTKACTLGHQIACTKVATK